LKENADLTDYIDPLKAQDQVAIYEGEDEGHTKWDHVLKYFENNPQALMEAIPTPRGEEEQANTPKAGNSFSAQQNLQRSASNRSFRGDFMKSTENIYSPKAGNLNSSRKFAPIPRRNSFT